MQPAEHGIRRKHAKQCKVKLLGMRSKLMESNGKCSRVHHKAALQAQMQHGPLAAVGHKDSVADGVT
jgi:hypothetical protein